VSLEDLHGPAGGKWTEREPLAGDASTRCYSRVRDGAGRHHILVEYPPEIRHHVTRDLEVSSWLRGHGIRVPAVLARDRAAGWIVVEDLGSTDCEATLRKAPAATRLQVASAALEPLVRLAALRTSALPSWNPPLDRVRMRWELAGFELWYVRYLRDAAPSARLSAWLDGLAARVADHPRRICHRDYHLNNLFPAPEGGVAVIDAQDALVGPDTYDGVSLVEERAMPELLSRGDLDRLRTEWAEGTRAADGWRRRWAEVRVQRGLKVLGTFARLTVAGRSGYRGWMDRLAARLAADADGLELAPEVADLLLDLDTA
jgi:aminoglycoside/choline kinase family phosphotransferase